MRPAITVVDLKEKWTRMHSSRMRTARFGGRHWLCWGGVHPLLPHPLPKYMLDKHLWKYYLPATSFVGSRKLTTTICRGLPVELRSLGDAYVRDEFKRHKDADVDFVPVFMTEWTVSAYMQQGRSCTEWKRTRKRSRFQMCLCNS